MAVEIWAPDLRVRRVGGAPVSGAAVAQPGFYDILQPPLEHERALSNHITPDQESVRQ
jgi:hypothetical protein